jgi:enamine deaminase RidA (YjgF/YER057c/UK114 family)
VTVGQPTVGDCRVKDSVELQALGLVLPQPPSQRGWHARSAVGIAELPFGIPVEIEAEVAIET